MIEYNIKINMQGERELCEDIVFTSGDKRGYRLNLAFYSNGKLYDASNCALTVKAKREDEAVITDSGVCTAEGVYYDVADNAIAVEGEVRFEIALVRANGEYVTTAVVLARVRKGFGEAGLLSSDNEPVLAKLEAQSLVTQAKANSVADDLAGHNADSEAHSEILKKERGVLANALKGEAKSASAVRIDDISPISHPVNIKLSSKNVLPYPYQDKDKTVNGITFTDNGDGSIHISGTATGTAIYYLTKPTFNAMPGDTFTLNMGTTCASNFYIALNYKNTSDTQKTAIGLKSGTSKTEIIPADFASFSDLFIAVLNGRSVDVTVYPQLEKGTTATAYTPYVADVTSANLTACGKNLFDLGHMAENYTGYNATYTDNSVTVTGTEDSSYQTVYTMQAFHANGDITITLKRISDANGKLSRLLIIPLDCNGNYLEDTYPIKNVNYVGGGSNKGTYYASAGYHGYYWDLPYDDSYLITANIPKEVASFRIAFILNKATYTFSDIQVELGRTDMPEYEPYVCTEYNVEADGTVEGVENKYTDMTLSTSVPGVRIECEYNKDINKAYAELQQAIISLGGNI